MKRSNTSSDWQVSNKRPDMLLSGTDILNEKLRLNNLFSVDPLYNTLDIMEIHAVKVLVIGKSSSGKSTVSNSLIGRHILPSGKEVVTKIPQIVTTTERNTQFTGYEVTWRYDKAHLEDRFSSIRVEKFKKITENPVQEKEEPKIKEEIRRFTDWNDVQKYLGEIFDCYTDVRYDDVVSIIEYVESPTHLHVIDVPGASLIEKFDDVIKANKDSIIMNVMGFEPHTLNDEYGIFNGMQRRKNDNTKMIMVMNKIDIGLESEHCEKKSNPTVTCEQLSRCTACLHNVTRLIDSITIMCEWALSNNVYFFLVQGEKTRFTEDQNIELLLSLMKDNCKNPKIIDHFGRGTKALRDLMIRLSSENYTVEKYDQIYNVLQNQNNADRDEIFKMDKSTESLSKTLDRRFDVGADIISKLEKDFIQANLERTVVISESMIYMEEQGEISNAYHGDRYPVVVFKHMMASDRLVDNTMDALANSSHKMSESILTGFENILRNLIKTHDTMKAGMSVHIITHWESYKRQLSSYFARLIRKTFIVSKHHKQKTFDVEENSKKKNDMLKKIEEEIYSKQVDGKSKANTIFEKIMGIFYPIHAKEKSQPRDIDAQDKGKLVDIETELENCNDAEEIKPNGISAQAKFVSPNSRFYKRKIYKMAREDLERCIQFATQSIFAHVMDRLMVKYPRDMVNYMYEIDRRMEYTIHIRIGEIKKRIECREKTCRDIRNLTDSMLREDGY